MSHQPKSGSKASRDSLRHEMLAAGCTTVDIAVEMRSRWRMRPREAWRHAHGWTLQETADRINDLSSSRPGPGGAVAADASLVGKWEKWPGPSSRRPSLTALLLIAEVFGCQVEDVIDLEDRRALPESDVRILHRAAPAEASSTPTVPRTAPQAPALQGPELVRTAAEESAAWARWAETTNIGELALEQVMSDTRRLSADYLTENPVTVFSRTRVLRDQVFALLEGRQHPRQTADLYAAAGYLCGLLAWMSSDFGRLQDADTQGRTAWLCAELAGHNDLRAWVLSTRSKIAFWGGRMKESITYARRGAAYAPVGTAGVLLACQEADAWSQLGAAHEAREALARASDAREQQGPDDIGGLFSCPECRRANYASAVMLRTGEPSHALQEIEEALAAQPAAAYGTQSQMRISQASAHLALGEPEGATEALQPVFALPPEQRLEPVTHRLHELVTTLARSRMATGASAAALQSAAEAFCLESVPRRIALSSVPAAS
ncbi:XRE family transcriptional regulator [Streptomyces sp. WAC 00631]|uniref:helix-turn-helix transcriptional regulator n=1 Tax=Streptomyces sp. WAC 00631 TaxID=2203201 RepID=UPI001E5EF622|nr:XRE family transcriptional regulator [Streptomyces sp. WAC 00631]MCC5035100.1 XRE family transcriptional regulator [Streptomyces sp. WAC 00631]